MTTTKTEPVINNYAKKQITAIIAIIVLIPALWITGVWVQVWNEHSGMTASARMSHFLDHFPSFMSTSSSVAMVNIILSVISLILAARSFKQRSVLLRVITMLTAMLASLVIILTVFMMF